MPGTIGRGRPATVPAGVRDPSGRASPGRDKLGTRCSTCASSVACRPRSTATRSTCPPMPARASCWRGWRSRPGRTRAPRSPAGCGPTCRRRAPARRCATRSTSCAGRWARRPADALIVSGERVGLSDAVRVDVGEFRRRVAAGELEAAADAGRGELLTGFDGDWARAARDEHATELAGVLGALAARAEEAGDLPAAVGWARRRLEVEPLGEAGASRADPPARPRRRSSRGARGRARDERAPAVGARAPAVGGDPGARRGRPPRQGPRAPRLRPRRRCRPPSPRPSTRRAAAQRCARLEQAWAEAVAGGRPVAFVTGEPGIGKTTLAGELGRRAHAQGGAVLLGRCDEQALVPFQPWIEALEGLLGALPAADVDHWLTAHDGALARLLPARSAVQAPAGDPRERYLAFELVRALLDDVAARTAGPARARRRALGRRRLAQPAAPPRPIGVAARLLVLLCARAAELGPADRPGARRAAARAPARPGGAGGPRRRRGGRAARAAHRRGRPRRPCAATASAAGATPTSSASCCARRGRPAGTSRTPHRACAT